MSKFLVAVLAVLLSFSTFASIASPTAREKARSNDILKFIAESGFLRNVALHSLINTRCERYAPTTQIYYSCSESVSALLELLDFDIKVIQTEGTPNPNSWKPEAFVFVAFKQNLLQVLRSPKTSKYLEELNRNLDTKIFNPSHDFSIWDFTKKFFGSESMAISVIAALFQDTSPLMLHVQFLEYNKIPGNQTFQTNKAELVRSIELINQILDSSEENFGEIFYPKQFQGKLNRSIYHFFVPLYLAKAMSDNGYSKTMSKIAPFMLTLTYEFITASDSYDYLFIDPGFLDSREHAWKLKDIYGGYSGSHFAVKEKAFKAFDTMSNLFDQSTEKAVKHMLK